MMARQLEQMVHLIDDLLEVSRISRGKIELKRAAFDLTSAIQHALEASKPLIDAAGHTLSIDVPPGPLIIEADLTRLAQVLGNLLNNAAKYTNPGGHIRLSVQRAGDRVSISVRDTGIGIPVDMLPKIFDMFAQLDSSTQRTQGGLGIGLSIAQRLVEMHGGTLEARSEGLGKGSEFVVELPLHDTATAQDAAPVEPPHAQSNERSLRVLVADDNEDAAATLAMVLEMKGHQVRTAHDGVEAVQIAERFKPEVAVLDIGMPRLDGYEVCKRLRAQPHGRDMLIVALTGWGQTEDKQRSGNAGFDHHLVKPANVGALEELLSSRESDK
jgi:CheY-like chemotaxis protein/two-component sensor histidine kinase